MYLILKKFLINKMGATAIEYGLIAALISISSIVAMQNTGEEVSVIFETVSQEFMDPDSTFSTGEAGVTTGNKLDDVTEVANAKAFEAHKLIDGINSQEELHTWLDSENGTRGTNNLTRPDRINNFLSDMSTIYGADMSQDLSSYGSLIDNHEFDQIMDNLNDTRRAL